VEVNNVFLGKRIREQRKKAGLTIEELAERCNKSESFIGNIERGDDTPSLTTLLVIANCLSVSFDCLLQDTLDFSMGREFANNYYLREINNELENMTAEQQKAIYEMIKAVKRYHT
jgi:transcriptional regulator with XRE-family HTH domain